MEARLRNAIPPGTRVGSARLLMEHEGFACSEQRSQPFGDASYLRDYIYCERTDGNITQLVHRVWKIALFEVDGCIQTIEVHTRLVGP
jgi:hypothetical protein